MRARQLLLGAAIGAGLIGGACGDDAPATAPAAVSVSATTTAPSGPVAAVSLVPGDCLRGFAIGTSERSRMDSAHVVGCDQPHEIEVFAAFALEPEHLDQDDTAVYPGQQRVVDRADDGCERLIADLVSDPALYGLIAVWPTAASWERGDREVLCAAYRADGQPFAQRTVV